MTSSSREAVAAAASSLRDPLTAFASEIVAIPSVTGGEGAVVERIRQEMVALGYQEVWVDPMGNLVGRLGTGERLLALDGHCDTVGVGDPEHWEVDPFGGVVRDGVLYGRGAGDQKGGLAAAAYGGRILADVGLPPGVSLMVAATVLEEDVEGLNWRYIIEEDGIVPDAVVLTEPTDMTVSIGQRGRAEIRVRTHGSSCHGSAPDRGVNAIYRMAPILREVEELHARMESASILGKGSVTVTDIRSTAPSLCAVPDSATIHLDRRVTEGETREGILQEIRGLPAVAAAQAEVFVPSYSIRTHTGLEVPAEAFYPAWLMDRAHPLVQAAVEASREQLDGRAEVSTWQFSTNGVVTKGVHGIPTIGLGPGSELYAHTPQDQVRVDDLVRAAAFYAALALRRGGV